MTWTYKGHSITKLPEEVTGFVYEIHYTDKTKYIGSKVVQSMQRVKPLAGSRSNAVRKKMVKSKWIDYEGSSNENKGKTIFSKVITHLCTSKRTMTYIEQRELMKVDATVNELYNNKNIGGKFHDNCLDGVYTGEVKQKHLFNQEE